MSNEQFQMLMDLVGTASDGAFWLVVVFFSVKIIGWLIAAVCLITIALLGVRISKAWQFEPSALSDIYREVIGTGVSGTYVAYDHQKVLDKLRKDRDAKL
jgi:hypothetical protein